MLSRRTLMRALAAGLACPAVPRLALAGQAAPKRLLVMWVPNGFRSHLWNPSGEGAFWTPSPIMAPLEAIRSDVLCVSGLDNLPGIYPDRYDEHTACTRATLTSAHRDGSPLAANAGWSVDQIIADHMGQNSAFKSLEVGSEGPLRCYTDGACPGFVTISWRGKTAPLAKDTSVVSVYHRLFGGLDPSLTGPERETRRRMEAALLSTVMDDTTAYRRLGDPLGKERIEQFVEGVSELQRRLDVAAEAMACPTNLVPEDPTDPTASIRAMADVLTLAFQCDKTRVVSWMLGTGRSERSLRFLGLDATHHELSHEGRWDDGHVAAGQWFVEQLVYVVQKLASTPDVFGGTLLDNTTVMFLSGIGECTSHLPLDLNVLMAGGGIPSLGERRVFEKGTPLANLHVSLLQKFGVDQSTFGDDGTGSLLDLG